MRLLNKICVCSTRPRYLEAPLDSAQRGTIRCVGRLLGEDPPEVPREAVEHLAGQLGIEDASCAKRFPERRSTVYERAAEIQKRFSYRDFDDRRWGSASGVWSWTSGRACER